MIFVKWFGWSVLWLLPLLLRTVARALGRKSIFGGRGAIRLWCGSLLWPRPLNREPRVRLKTQKMKTKHPNFTS